MLNDIFDNVYCINLERRPDRWEQFKKLWDPMEVKIERFLGVDSENLNYADDSYRTDYHHNIASISCALSHIQVLERALYCKQKEILVLEDDAQPCADFLEKFKVAYNELPENYNFCYIGGTNMTAPKNFSEHLGIATSTKSTVAYCIKTDFAPLLIKNIKHNIDNFAVDEIYENMQSKNDFYVCSPRLMHQYESYSDIVKSNVYYHWMRDLP